jgi:hypothetical protein
MKRNFSCLPQPLCILPAISQAQTDLHLARSLDLSLRYLPRAVLQSVLGLACFYKWKCLGYLCGNLIATKNCGICCVSHHHCQKPSVMSLEMEEKIHIHPGCIPNLIASYITAFMYGKSCVLAKVTSSSLDGNARPISSTKHLRGLGLLTSCSRHRVSVMLVVSVPATLFICQKLVIQ